MNQTRNKIKKESKLSKQLNQETEEKWINQTNKKTSNQINQANENKQVNKSSKKISQAIL